MDSSDSPRRWSPDSWRAKPAAQMPTYRDADALQRALARLARLPPLVTSWEVETLKRELGDAARGRRFVLQGGDCSENFEDCESGAITNIQKFCDSIRNNTPIDNTLESAHSTMTSILGRMAAYTGNEVSWDEMVSAGAKLDPKLNLPTDGRGDGPERV